MASAKSSRSHYGSPLVQVNSLFLYFAIAVVSHLVAQVLSSSALLSLAILWLRHRMPPCSMTVLLLPRCFTIQRSRKQEIINFINIQLSINCHNSRVLLLNKGVCAFSNFRDAVRPRHFFVIADGLPPDSSTGQCFRSAHHGSVPVRLGRKFNSLFKSRTIERPAFMKDLWSK
jgi:hypothetical protein